MNSTVRAWLARLLPLLVSAFLAACGGGGGGVGGGGGDTTPPTITAVNVPDGAANVSVGAVLQATFSEPVRNVNTATFRLEGAGAPVTGTVVLGGGTATFTPSANLYTFTRYTATLSAGVAGVTDLAGNPLAVDYTWSFTTGAAPDTTPPTVVATSPTAGQTGVAINTIVMATFSEPVRNVDGGTFRLEVGGTPVNGVARLNGATATFTPAATLATLTTYTATVARGVTDLAGNPLAADSVWSFTTGAAPDTTPPTVILTSPTAGQAGVPVSTRIQATFSEAVKNLGTATFLLRDGAGAAVPGTVTGSGDTATFTPSANLAYLARYSATVTTGVTDLANNPLAADFDWSFTTAAAPGSCVGCHGGADGSQPGVNGAPVVTRYWQTSGHGMSARGPAANCEDCHDVGSPAGTHAADGTGAFNTLSWPGKPAVTTHANTAHLNNFFFPVTPATAADYAAAFDDACGNRIGCHARAGGGRIAKVMRHAIWSTTSDDYDPDYLMEFGNHGSAPDPKIVTWYSQGAYADDFYHSQSPWVIHDLTTDASPTPVVYGTCVTCHDPHGTGITDNNDAGRNVMLRGMFKSRNGGFCNGAACHP